MTNESVPQAEVDSWIERIANLNFNVWTVEDGHLAERAVANLWSEFGFLDAPTEVLHMFQQAVEAGYMAALKDVREGNYDAEIAEW